MFVFTSWLVSHEVCIHIQYFFGGVRNKLQTILTNEKHFPRTISQWEFDYGLSTNLPRIVEFTDFSPSSYKLKRGIPPLLTKYVSWLKNYLSYQAKIFLVNLTPKDLLLAKYLIFVGAPLKKIGFNPRPDIMLIICYWQEILLLTLTSDSEAIL